jgi:predicted Zn finger-like uncharacterized protein
MIISCPSCNTKFRVADARLKSGGQKVRCSKCGHLWRLAEDKSQAPKVATSETRPAGNRPTVPAGERQEQSASEREPVLTAERESEPDPVTKHNESISGEQRPAASNPAEPGADGLTEEQRARLHAARETQKKPRGGFRIKILLILVMVGILLLLALRMAGVPIPGLPQLSEAIEGLKQEAPVREVGKVDAKPVPSTPATEGHIIGGDTPKKSAN